MNVATDVAGNAVCIECGETTPLLLAPRFPHICAACLFPPQRPEDPTADGPDILPTETLMARVNRAGRAARPWNPPNYIRGANDE